MTPKEKATELWNKYVEAKIVTEGKYSNYRGLTTEHAKVCALIAVDEILEGLGYNKLSDSPYTTLEARQYYVQVRQELKNK